MSTISGAAAPHRVDRAFTEVLQEMRVAQTGGQIFFAFLFSVAFTPVFASFGEAQKALYQWDLAVVVLSMALLVSPVAVHRALFGLRARPWVLRVAHVTTMLGLALLAVGILLGVGLIALVVSPANPWPLTAGCAVSLLVSWVGLPLAVRRAVRADPDPSDQQVGGDQSVDSPDERLAAGPTDSRSRADSS